MIISTVLKKTAFTNKIHKFIYISSNVKILYFFFNVFNLRFIKDNKNTFIFFYKNPEKRSKNS
jgi:hypothetical protein